MHITDHFVALILHVNTMALALALLSVLLTLYAPVMGYVIGNPMAKRSEQPSTGRAVMLAVILALVGLLGE